MPSQEVTRRSERGNIGFVTKTEFKQKIEHLRSTLERYEEEKHLYEEQIKQVSKLDPRLGELMTISHRNTLSIRDHIRSKTESR